MSSHFICILSFGQLIPNLALFDTSNTLIVVRDSTYHPLVSLSYVSYSPVVLFVCDKFITGILVVFFSQGIVSTISSTVFNICCYFSSKRYRTQIKLSPYCCSSFLEPGNPDLITCVTFMNYDSRVI